jgi:hypothetical protein
MESTDASAKAIVHIARVAALVGSDFADRYLSDWRLA